MLLALQLSRAAVAAARPQVREAVLPSFDLKGVAELIKSGGPSQASLLIARGQAPGGQVPWAASRP